MFGGEARPRPALAAGTRGIGQRRRGGEHVRHHRDHRARHPSRTRPRVREAADASVIGRAIPGLRVVVLDERLHSVPPGVVGEMYVAGGEQLTRGYLGRSALTSSRSSPTVRCAGIPDVPHRRPRP
ncbi:AMP-binding protein [Rhodococcus hoagii]|nr:AMP-binding protein [Prescottella equi]